MILTARFTAVARPAFGAAPGAPPPEPEFRAFARETSKRQTPRAAWAPKSLFKMPFPFFLYDLTSFNNHLFPDFFRLFPLSAGVFRAGRRSDSGAAEAEMFCRMPMPPKKTVSELPP